MVSTNHLSTSRLTQQSFEIFLLPEKKKRRYSPKNQYNLPHVCANTPEERKERAVWPRITIFPPLLIWDIKTIRVTIDAKKSQRNKHRRANRAKGLTDIQVTHLSSFCFAPLTHKWKSNLRKKKVLPIGPNTPRLLGPSSQQARRRAPVARSGD